MISKKLNFIIFSTIILASIILLASTILDTRHEQEVVQRQIKYIENSIKEEYKKRLKESVNHTIMFIEACYQDKITEQIKRIPNSKELTKENKLILENIIRNYLYSSIFEKSRYSWINEIIDFKGGDNYAIRLIHPNLKKTEGSFLTTNEKDIKGNSPYLEELEGVKKDAEIYLTYYFKQINKDKVTEKMSYAKLYERFNWVVATGIPINDLNNIISQKRATIEEEHKKHILAIILLRAFVLLLFIGLLLLLRKRLSKTMNKNVVLNKQLKKRLKSVETNFDKFFDLPVNLFLISDFEGNILKVNPGWKKILGYQENELLEKKFYEFIHPNDITPTKEEIGKLSKGDKTFYFENKYRHKNGTYRSLAWSSNSVPEKRLLYSVAQDITEIKEKTHIMYQQSKMAAIGEMIANIAHQWRQPLSIISTSSSGVLLKKENNDLDDKFLIDTMNQITQSTQELSKTLDDFRNFFTPYKEKSYFTTEQIFKKLLNLMEKRFEDHNIKIVKNIENISISNYENELLQVLINILNNAKEQLNKLDLEEKFIFINCYEKDKKLYIEIIDNGNGIDKNIIDRVFEPYFTTKDKTMGTGIGLYMSEKIVRKHLEGNLLVENITFTYKDKRLQGASFTIIL